MDFKVGDVVLVFRGTKISKRKGKVIKIDSDPITRMIKIDFGTFVEWYFPEDCTPVSNTIQYIEED